MMYVIFAALRVESGALLCNQFGSLPPRLGGRVLVFDFL
jgi:hypothetical protein